MTASNGSTKNGKGSKGYAALTDSVSGCLWWHLTVDQPPWTPWASNPINGVPLEDPFPTGHRKWPVRSHPFL